MNPTRDLPIRPHTSPHSGGLPDCTNVGEPVPSSPAASTTNGLNRSSSAAFGLLAAPAWCPIGRRMTIATVTPYGGAMIIWALTRCVRQH